MGSRALIGKLTENNQVEYIYVHHGGYEEVFEELLVKYNKQEEVDGLISRGSSSSLDENHYTDGSEAKPLSLQEFMAEAACPSLVLNFLYMHGVWTMMNPSRYGLDLSREQRLS